MRPAPASHAQEQSPFSLQRPAVGGARFERRLRRAAVADDARARRLLVVEPTRELAGRGELRRLIDDAVEQSLAERGAVPPTVGADATIGEWAGDQAFRMRALGVEGVCILFPGLRFAADHRGALDEIDGAVLRAWLMLSREYEIEVILDEADRELTFLAPCGIATFVEPPTRVAEPPVATPLAGSAEVSRFDSEYPLDPDSDAIMPLDSEPPSEPPPHVDVETKAPASVVSSGPDEGYDIPSLDAASLTWESCSVVAGAVADAIAETGIGAAGVVITEADGDSAPIATVDDAAAEPARAEPAEAEPAEAEPAEAEPVEAEPVEAEPNQVAEAQADLPLEPADVSQVSEAAASDPEEVVEASDTEAKAQAKAELEAQIAALELDLDEPLQAEPATASEPGPTNPEEPEASSEEFEPPPSLTLPTPQPRQVDEAAAARSLRAAMRAELGDALRSELGDALRSELGEAVLLESTLPATPSPAPAEAKPEVAPSPAAPEPKTSRSEARRRRPEHVVDGDAARGQGADDRRSKASSKTEARTPAPQEVAASGDEAASASDEKVVCAAEWRQFALELDEATGPKPVKMVEKLFRTRYVPLLGARARGELDGSVKEVVDRWGRSFAESYADSFSAIRVTGRRPPMVLDAPSIATRIGKINGARSVHLMMIDSLSFELGERLAMRMREQLAGQAVCVERTMLWSALPTTTPVQLKLIGRGPEAMRDADLETPGELDVARGRAVSTPRRVRTGNRELLKLDLIEARLRGPGQAYDERMEAIVDEVFDALSRYFETLPPRSLAFVFGDHGFRLGEGPRGWPTGPAAQGGSTPEEVLVSGHAWLIDGMQ